MPKAYSYLRFSTPEQHKGDSFRRQTALATEVARRHGLDLDTELTFQDLGVSAFRGKNAEVGRLADFLAAVDDGLIAPGSWLLVESLDRISRQFPRRAARVLEQIVDRGVTVCTTNDGKIYTAKVLDEDPLAFIVVVLTFSRANEESATKSRRLLAAWSAKRARAVEKPLTRICPAWLHLDGGQFRPIPERAAIIQRIFAEAAAGRGQHAIAEKLNKDKVPVFGRGGQWHRSYIVKILGNLATIGTATPHRIEHTDGIKRRVPLDTVPGYYPAVVSQDIFERVQSLADGARQPLRGRHANGAIVSNIIGGLARCPACGGTMTRITKGPKWHYLVCTAAKAGAGCKYQLVRYSDVEDAIVLTAAEIVDGAPSGDDTVTALKQEMARAETAVDLLIEQRDGLLETASYRPSASIATRIAETEQKLEAGRKEVADLESQIAALVPARWQSRLVQFLAATKATPIDRQAVNASLRALMSAVIVDYARPDSPASILRFTWKNGGETFVHYVRAVPRTADAARRRRRI